MKFKSWEMIYPQVSISDKRCLTLELIEYLFGSTVQNLYMEVCDLLNYTVS